MGVDISTGDCQAPCLPHIAMGHAEMPPQSPLRRLKLMIRRRTSPQTERHFKARTNAIINCVCRVMGKAERPTAAPGLPQQGAVPQGRLQAGDWVRIRSREEIDSTLNHWRQLRGCTFMNEMTAYCGTVQRVLKPLQRFVDERDLRVKTARGIVLLDGVVCQGTADFGPCDRCCVLFWREEWLEKIDRPEHRL